MRGGGEGGRARIRLLLALLIDHRPRIPYGTSLVEAKTANFDVGSREKFEAPQAFQ